MSAAMQHPGAILLERYLQPLGITKSQLADSIGVAVRRVSDLIAGRQAMTLDMAARLALFFDVPSEWWLAHQARYDAKHVAPLDALRSVVTPYEKLSDVLVTPHGVELLAPAEAVREEISTATFSADFVTRLRSQVGPAEDSVRTVSEMTLADGTVALVGE